jgi:hypothetical protein
MILRAHAAHEGVDWISAYALNVADAIEEGP